MTESHSAVLAQRLDASRLPQLDLLRGIAVSLVLARHLSFSFLYAGKLAPVVKLGYDFGWTGVDLFFVLSGFLVGGLLFKEWRRDASLDVGRFLIRRGFKIWPAYVVYIVSMTVVYIYDGTQGPPRHIITSFFPNFVHLQSYAPTPLLHTWSLSVEEHFYLVLPLILWLASDHPTQRRQALRVLLMMAAGIAILVLGIHFALQSFLPLSSLPGDMQNCLRAYLQPTFLCLFGLQVFSLFALCVLLPRFFRHRNDLPALPLIAIGVLVLCGVFRVTNYWLSTRLGIDWSFNFFATHLRIDSIFFGVLLGYWHHFHGDKLQRVARHRGLLCLVGVALILCAVYGPWPILFFSQYLCFILLYLGYGCLLLAVVYTPLGEGWLGKSLNSFPARRLAYIGYYSYSIYLWHISVTRYRIDRWLYLHWEGKWPTEVRWLLMTTISIAGAILLGVLMAKLIEQPFLRLRDRFFPGRAKALVEQSEAAAMDFASQGLNPSTQQSPAS